MGNLGLSHALCVCVGGGACLELNPWRLKIVGMCVFVGVRGGAQLVLQKGVA